MNSKLKQILISTALLFMIAELSYINSKSLFHLSGSATTIHQAFAIIGAIAFSIVTIIIMQQPGIKWQKVVFPTFDAALVFLGFNLDLYPNMRIYLTVFMAVFAGLIMYSLGLIEYKTGETFEARELVHQKERANSLGKELDSVKSELKESQAKISELNTYYSSIESDKDKLESQLLLAQSKIEVMEPVFKKYELGRIRKKHEDNRTPEEAAFLESV